MEWILSSHEYGILCGNVYGVIDVGGITRHFPTMGGYMKKTVFLGFLLVAASAFAADVYVQPHVTSNGTYVPGHYRTSPDSNPYNNYSTQGNYNPYTGQQGTVNPYATPQPIYPQQQRCRRDAYGNISCY